MAASFARLRSAAIDGRLQNPLYRKAQLKNLHDSLLDSAEHIQGAILRDTNHRLTEVKVQYALALKFLADAYNSIDPIKILRDEYAIANNQNAPAACVPFGIVVIETASHTFLSSLTSAVAPALGAGNCIVVKAETNLFESPRLILEVFTRALDHDVFTYTFDLIDDTAIGISHCRIIQGGTTSSGASNHIVSNTQARVVAIVERDADIDAAAAAIVEAGFTLRGQSPYAPDMVLVNEWIKHDFLSTLVQKSVQFESANDVIQQNDNSQGIKFLQELEGDKSATVAYSSDSGYIVMTEDRSFLVQHSKLVGPFIALLGVTSIDDVIDISKKVDDLAALYVFTTNLAAAKYICQFTNANIKFVNQIPRSIHYGPIAPVSQSWSPQSRSCYEKNQFTRKSPSYIKFPSTLERFEAVGLCSPAHQRSILDIVCSAKLPDTKRGSGPTIGFFEQGILTSMTLVITITFSAIGAIGYIAWRKLW